MRFNEPEGHLNSLFQILVNLSGLKENAKVLGLTYLDDSLLLRFRNFGCAQAVRPDPVEHLGLDLQDTHSLISLQEAYTNRPLDSFVDNNGRADLVIVRYLLEHARNPPKFLESLKRALKPDGFLMVEVPDARKFLEAFDYPFVWEEHMSYFTPSSLIGVLAECGFYPVTSLVYPYALENSLVLIAKQGARKSRKGIAPSGEAMKRARAFADGFVAAKAWYQARLDSLGRKEGKIALLGAGHLAARFLNFYNVGPSIEVVVDDLPAKAGLVMPGSQKVIEPTSAVEERQISVCVLSLNPESEFRFLSQKRHWLERGIQFKSIFVRSPVSLRI
jgi:SAM-dependent methyltransferase